MKITSVKALEILDSRGNPTVSATVTLEDGSIGWAGVPSGASTGKYEAVELRDGDKNRFGGTGVLKAIENVNTKIAEKVIGMDASDQKAIDDAMLALDGTENKANLGANAILAVSLATARAAAVSEKKELFDYLTKFNPDFSGTYELPIPMMNVMNGGKHAGWATDIQEYMILPIGAKTESDAIRMCAEVYQILKKIIKDKGYATNVGDEGGFAPSVSSNEEPFALLMEAIEKAGYKPGVDISLGIDAAASEFYEDGKYNLKREGKVVTSDELSAFYQELISKYPIISMEDIFGEDDWDAYKKFHAANPNLQLVGDDLYVTNVKRLQMGIDNKSSNSILIKLNQIGSLTETIDAILLARKNGMSSVVSHRSGETEDTFISDFCVAMGTGQIKTGAPARSERTAKYNRLLTIDNSITNKKYATFPFVK
ncbi:MAG TPA: phosphopyruvate hydratase [Patescibacteria group bacterium]|nr:phosphopyruvate hydratase [Patescibacteria group bacterium]